MNPRFLTLLLYCMCTARIFGKSHQMRGNAARHPRPMQVWSHGWRLYSALVIMSLPCLWLVAHRQCKVTVYFRDQSNVEALGFN